MKKILYLSLFLNVAFLSIVVGKKIYASSTTSPVVETFADKWNRYRTAVFDSTSVKEGDFLFLGDSNTEGFLVSEIFGSKAKNRGITSNNSFHILARVKSLVKNKPAKIFLQIGANDLREDIPVDVIITNITQTSEIVRKQSPGTKVYLISVFPTGGDYFMIQPQIVILNRELQKFCAKNNISYIDIYSSLIEDGSLNPDYTVDGIHLNGSGYKVWERIITKYVNE